MEHLEPYDDIDAMKVARIADIVGNLYTAVEILYNPKTARWLKHWIAKAIWRQICELEEIAVVGFNANTYINNTLATLEGYNGE